MTSVSPRLPPAGTRKPRKGIRSRRAPLLLIAPFGLFFAAFFIAPIGYALVQSLTTYERAGSFGLRKTVFAGLDNYRTVLGSSDFLAACGHVLLYVAVLVPLMLAVSVGVALMVDTAAMRRWARSYQFVFFLPYAVPGVIATLVWGFLYLPQLDPILRWLNTHGIDIAPMAGGSLPFSFANINIWMFFGYNVVVISAALRTIPGEVLEAARLDGASTWRTALAIKLPLIRPAVSLIFVFTLIGAFQLFNEPQILKDIGADVSSTYTPNLMSYSMAFANNYPVAATLSVVLAGGTAVASFLMTRTLARFE
ncbi:carbohydrate ABC transporter permease [Streptomyces sp. NPDC102360]|uniref:carbohydrate ABC transporter permease n=1 Tax=Streptomyces sp. NPDC102360 TaxID=3366160 RepID=UPI00381AC8D2